MPIPFHNDEALSSLGAAAFLVVKAVSEDPYTCVGGIFVINAIGEPLEFVFNRVELIPSILWSGVDTQRAATSRLLSSLFDAVELTPKLLFIQADSAKYSTLESIEPLRLGLPTIAVTSPNGNYSGPATVIWGPTAPAPEESRLYELISSRGLLFEPFLRTCSALREVYKEWANLL